MMVICYPRVWDSLCSKQCRPGPKDHSERSSKIVLSKANSACENCEDTFYTAYFVGDKKSFGCGVLAHCSNDQFLLLCMLI